MFPIRVPHVPPAGGEPEGYGEALLAKSATRRPLIQAPDRALELPSEVSPLLGSYPIVYLIFRVAALTASWYSVRLPDCVALTGQSHDPNW